MTEQQQGLFSLRDLTAAQEAKIEADLEAGLADPIPRELRKLLADAIEPHTINMGIKHGDVLECVQCAPTPKESDMNHTAYDPPLPAWVRHLITVLCTLAAIIVVAAIAAPPARAAHQRLAAAARPNVPQGHLKDGNGWCLTNAGPDVVAEACQPAPAQRWQLGQAQVRTPAGLCLTTRPHGALYTGLCGKPGTGWLYGGHRIRPAHQPWRCLTTGRPVRFATQAAVPRIALPERLARCVGTKPQHWTLT